MLKHIIAKRLTYIAFKCKLFNLLYFGIIFSCSAVNIAIILTYNIKKAFQNKKIMIALIFNIKKLFDKMTDGWFMKKL